MSRCSIPRWSLRPIHRRCALTLSISASLAAVLPAQAQVARVFPQTALRGEIAFGQAPEIELNGVPARLAPGARVRKRDNMLAMSAALTGERHWVHYTLEESSGLVMNVWILREDELSKRPWPTTAEQARNWVFDPVAQTWSRR
jgi:hypothetical protein